MARGFDVTASSQQQRAQNDWAKDLLVSKDTVHGLERKGPYHWDDPILGVYQGRRLVLGTTTCVYQQR